MTHATVLDHDAGERWDAADVRALLALRAQGCTLAECAARRTTAAVRSKLYRLRRAG